MKTCVVFASAGLEFLVDVADVVEVFDRSASAESIADVLVGHGQWQSALAEVYWRQQPAMLLDMNQLLEADNADTCCFVVCRRAGQPGPLQILQVDAIHGLRAVEEESFRPLPIAHPRLQQLGSRVYLDPVTRLTAYVLEDIRQLFASPS